MPRAGELDPPSALFQQIVDALGPNLDAMGFLELGFGFARRAEFSHPEFLSKFCLRICSHPPLSS